MISATVTSKGQITIPAEIRKALNIAEGDQVVFSHLGNGQISFWARNRSIRDLKGIVPKLDYVPSLEELEEGIAEAIEEEYLRSVGSGRESESSSLPEGEAA
jgi:antitoxin PrlF